MLISEIEKEKIIVVIRGVEGEKILPLVDALYKGGIKFVEVAFPQGGDTQTTVDSIKLISEKFKGKVHVGAGTVLTENQVELTAQAGGEFIISPDVCDKIIKKTKELGLISIPGAYTPTEVMNAERNGADFVKLFPANEIAPSYIKAIRLPLNKVKLLAVGGINLNNIKEYLDVGVCGFGLSSGIIDKNLLESEDYDGIKNLAQKHVDIIKKWS